MANDELLTLLRGILATGNSQAGALLDMAESARRDGETRARQASEHEAAAAKRHEELRPALDALHRQISAREDAVAKADAATLWSQW